VDQLQPGGRRGGAGAAVPADYQEIAPAQAYQMMMSGKIGNNSGNANSYSNGANAICNANSTRTVLPIMNQHQQQFSQAPQLALNDQQQQRAIMQERAAHQMLQQQQLVADSGAGGATSSLSGGGGRTSIVQEQSLQQRTVATYPGVDVDANTLQIQTNLGYNCGNQNQPARQVESSQLAMSACENYVGNYSGVGTQETLTTASCTGTAEVVSQQQATTGPAMREGQLLMQQQHQQEEQSCTTTVARAPAPTSGHESVAALSTSASSFPPNITDVEQHDQLAQGAQQDTSSVDVVSPAAASCSSTSRIMLEDLPLDEERKVVEKKVAWGTTSNENTNKEPSPAQESGKDANPRLYREVLLRNAKTAHSSSTAAPVTSSIGFRTSNKQREGKGKTLNIEQVPSSSSNDAKNASSVAATGTSTFQDQEERNHRTTSTVSTNFCADSSSSQSHSQLPAVPVPTQEFFSSRDDVGQRIEFMSHEAAEVAQLHGEIFLLEYRLDVAEEMNDDFLQVNVELAQENARLKREMRVMQEELAWWKEQAGNANENHGREIRTDGSSYGTINADDPPHPSSGQQEYDPSQDEQRHPNWQEQDAELCEDAGGTAAVPISYAGEQEVALAEEPQYYKNCDELYNTN
ncbi:unnamed protein product, partial [Amoebophrya sp. A120]